MDIEIVIGRFREAASVGVDGISALAACEIRLLYADPGATA
ncbi:MAG TPA: hypothetical protein VIY52_07185 [Streptosporangiaceae bacterium]